MDYLAGPSSRLCRREGIASSMYYGWSKEFLEAGKRRLAGSKTRPTIRTFDRSAGTIHGASMVK
jgi:hypothetical protein